MHNTIKNIKQYALATLALASIVSVSAQENNISQKGHENKNKFKQLYDEFSTPNVYRTASGAPGHEYYQQRADYKIKVELTDPTDGTQPKLTG